MIKIEVNKVIKGDCLVESEQIESGSVDLILTDPPYGTTEGINKADKYECFGEGWDEAIPPKKLFEVANRILRKNGKLILFSQEPYTSQLITKAISNLPFSYRMVWLKDHFSNCLLANKAPVSYFEDILVFSKEHDIDNLHPLRNYFDKVKNYIGETKTYIMDTIGQRADHTFRTTSTQFSLCTKETYQDLTEEFKLKEMQGYKTYKQLREIDKSFDSTFNLPKNKKYKSNILECKKDYGGLHPTQKPVALLEDLIKTYSNEGDLVVDLTAGSGGTGKAAKNLNRKYILIEQKEKYIDVINERLG